MNEANGANNNRGSGAQGETSSAALGNVIGQAFGQLFGQALNQLDRDMGTYLGGGTRLAGSTEPRILTPTERVAPIIARVEDEVSRRTLESVDPTEIQAVGRAVYRERDRNPDLTDREVYLTYHRAAAGREVPNPRFVEGFKIVKLLMGDSNGTLPF